MAETQLKRHPWRAAIWGFVLGLGVLVYLTFVWPVIGFDDVFSVAWKAALVVVGTMLLAVLWGLFGPAKKPKGPAPAYAEAAPAAPVDDTPPPAPDEPAASDEG